MTIPTHHPSAVRRRLVPPLVGVTVLAVLLGGGYVLHRGSDNAATGGGAPTVLRLADYQPPSAGNPADDQFRLAADLPGGPADAAVRWLTSPAVATVERLAKALGMRGQHTRAGGASTYTTDTASLRVQQGAGGEWQYVRGVFTNGAVTSTSAAPRSGSATKLLAVTSPEAARAAARPVLDAAGIDADNAVVRAGAVVAEPTVAGLVTHGLTTTVRVSGDRVTSAGGWLGGSRAGATYPVISAKAAWQRLVRTPLARPLIACPEPQPDGSDPMICGGPITVTGARFGLSLHQENGRPLLVPSWLFDVRGSDTALAVVAVAPRYLAAPPVATAGGSEPGSSGSGSSGSGSSGSTGSVVPPVSASPGPATMAPSRDSRFSSVTAAGTGLTVAFTGGVSACFSYTVTAAETDRKVSLSLVERSSSDKVCVEMAQVYERRVGLAEPLGTRTVVDAATGAVLLGPSR